MNSQVTLSREDLITLLIASRSRFDPLTARCYCKPEDPEKCFNHSLLEVIERAHQKLGHDYVRPKLL